MPLNADDLDELGSVVDDPNLLTDAVVEPTALKAEAARWAAAVLRKEDLDIFEMIQMGYYGGFAMGILAERYSANVPNDD
jgi:hypothetical protein